MRRFYLALSLALALVMVALPTAAARPSGGCGAVASGWHVVTFQQWVEATEAAAGELTPAEEAEIKAGIVPFDKNNDKLVCMKDFQPSGNTPAYPPGFFNIKDNTAAAGA